MLPLVILLNMIFFFWGYCQNITLKNISHPRDNWEALVVGLAVLIGVLTLLIWLIFYLRQNAFKTLLPISRFHLQKEFSLILIIVFGLCSAMVIGFKGLNSKIVKVSKAVNIEKENRIISLGNHFLPFDTSEFSPRRIYDTHKEDDTGRLDDGMVPKFSYLNYRMHIRSEYGDDYDVADSLLDVRAVCWLKDHRKDSIVNCIDKYLQLCRKYGGEYKFSSTTQVNSIFSTTDFEVKKELPQTKYGSDRKAYPYYIDDRYRASGALSVIGRERRGIPAELYLSLVLAAICISFGIFSFRITPLKTWISAIVVGGVLAVCVSVVFATIYSRTIFPLFLTSLELITLSICVVNILRRKHKYISGIAYVLALSMLSFFILAIYWGLKAYIQDKYYVVDESVLHHGRLYEFKLWLDANSNNFFIGNNIFALLMMFFVMIPLIKKWRANPEE
jgi:hypothetical protein